MTDIKSENLAEIYKKLESGTDPEKVLAMFPGKKEEIKKIISLIDYLRKENKQIKAPKEILQKILNKNTLLNKTTGRSSVLEDLKKIIININFMNQKSKLAFSALAIVAVLTVGIAVFKSNDKNSDVTLNQKKKTISENKLVTTTPIIGDKEIDTSINNALNEVLNENDLDSELEDIELALSDEAELDQINNLINDDEL